MGLTVAKLASEERSFVWHYLGEDVPIRYRPGVLTLAWDEQDVHVALSETLISIDILNGSGKPIKTDAATLVKTLTVPIMRTIAKAIYEDAGVGPTKAGTSGAT
jgi:hypothetical protein